MLKLIITFILAATLGGITGYITYYIEEHTKRKKLEKERMWKYLKHK